MTSSLRLLCQHVDDAHPIVFLLELPSLVIGVEGYKKNMEVAQALSTFKRMSSEALLSG